MRRLLHRRESLPAILVVLAFIAGVIESPYFLDARYLLDATSLYIETGLLVLGMTFVIVSGQIDLSVAAILALAACVAAKLLAAGLPPVVVFPAAVALGALLGGFNGLLVSRLRLPSFVVTLGTMAAFRGIAQAMMGAESQRLPASLVGIDYLKLPGTPVPWMVVGLVLIAVLLGRLLHHTVFGRWVFSLGTNERASFYSGMPTDRVKASVFVISGALAGLAGIVIDSRLGVARFDHARGLELDVITAVVLGGASISGGVGTILGSMLALLLIALLRTGMGVANVTAENQLAVIGTLLIVATLAGTVAERLWYSNRSRRAAAPAEGASP